MLPLVVNTAYTCTLYFQTQAHGFRKKLYNFPVKKGIYSASGGVRIPQLFRRYGTACGTWAFRSQAKMNFSAFLIRRKWLLKHVGKKGRKPLVMRFKYLYRGLGNSEADSRDSARNSAIHSQASELQNVHRLSNCWNKLLLSVKPVHNPWASDATVVAPIWHTCLNLKNAFCLQLAAVSQLLFIFTWKDLSSVLKRQLTWTQPPRGSKLVYPQGEDQCTSD